MGVQGVKRNIRSGLDGKDTVTVRFSSKPSNLEDLIPIEYRGLWGRTEKVNVEKTFNLHTLEYDNYTEDFYSDDNWSQFNLGKYYSVIRVTAPDRPNLIIDSQGFDYPRYVAYEGVEETKKRERNAADKEMMSPYLEEAASRYNGGNKMAKRNIRSSSNLKDAIKSAKELKLQLFDTGAFKLDLSQEKDGSLLCSSVNGASDVGAVLSVASRDGHSFTDLSQGVDLSGSPLLNEYKDLLVSTASFKQGEDKPITRKLDNWVISGKELGRELERWGFDNKGQIFQSMQVLGTDLVKGDSYKAPIRSASREISDEEMDNYSISDFDDPNRDGEIEEAIRYRDYDGWDDSNPIRSASLGFKKPIASTGNGQLVKSSSKQAEAWRIFNKLVSEEPEWSENKVIEYTAAIMGTNEQAVREWLAEGVSSSYVKSAVSSSSSPRMPSSSSPNLSAKHQEVYNKLKEAYSNGQSPDLVSFIKDLHWYNVPVSEAKSLVHEWSAQLLSERSTSKMDSDSSLPKYEEYRDGSTVYTSRNGTIRYDPNWRRSSVQSAMKDTPFVGTYEDEDGALYMPDDDPCYDVDEDGNPLNSKSFFVPPDSEVGVALQYVIDNNIPHDFERIYEALSDSDLFNAYIPNVDDMVYDIAFLVCDQLGVPVASSFHKRIPIQQDLKGLISMIKNWLQRLHEGLMEQNVFYQNLMRLLKGNGYPGSKANSIYEGLMAGQPVEAVMASVKRVASSFPSYDESTGLYEDEVSVANDYTEILMNIKRDVEAGNLLGDDIIDSLTNRAGLSQDEATQLLVEWEQEYPGILSSAKVPADFPQPVV